jgi:hypothetical protein
MRAQRPVFEVLVAVLLVVVVVFELLVPASPAEEGTPLPVVLSRTTPLLVPPMPVAVAAPGLVEPDVVEVSVVLQAASDRARMPPSRALWIAFMGLLLMWMGPPIMRGACFA